MNERYRILNTQTGRAVGFEYSDSYNAYQELEELQAFAKRAGLGTDLFKVQVQEYEPEKIVGDWA